MTHQVSRYDELSNAIRKESQIIADRDYQERLNRQVSIAQTMAEEVAEILVRVDIDDDGYLQAALSQLEVVYSNARMYLLEALENKRLRRALNGP